jgi:hypothetical protein
VYSSRWRLFDGITPPSEIAFDKVAFWVRMYNLPLACMGQDIGRQIGASIGEVELVETDEDGAAWGEFLRAQSKGGHDQTSPTRKETETSRKINLGTFSI